MLNLKASLAYCVVLTIPTLQDFLISLLLLHSTVSWVTHCIKDSVLYIKLMQAVSSLHHFFHNRVYCEGQKSVHVYGLVMFSNSETLFFAQRLRLWMFFGFVYCMYIMWDGVTMHAHTLMFISVLFLHDYIKEKNKCCLVTDVDSTK